MESDIENLFKKIEGSADSYQEIHRNNMDEQAMQRWPLLRDVRINSAKSVIPPPAMKFEQEKNEDTPEALLRHLKQNGHHAENNVVEETISEQLRAQISSEKLPRNNMFDQSPKKSSQLIHSSSAHVTNLTQESDDTQLQALFKRLAESQAPENLPGATINSFFKKIFKP